MIDLKKLEKNLDYVLAKETASSLSQWLLEKRSKRINYNLGKGHLEELDNGCFEITNVEIEECSPKFNKKKEKIQDSPQYRMAA